MAILLDGRPAPEGGGAGAARGGLRETWGRPDVAAGLAMAAVGYTLTSLGAVVALLARDLDRPVASLGWLSSAFAVGLLLAAPAGPLLLRAGPRPLLRAGAATALAGVTVLATAATEPLAAAGGLLLGAGNAGLVLATPALLAGPRAAGRLTRANAVSSVAAVVAPLALGGLDRFGPGGRLALLAVVPPLVLLVLGRAPGDAAGAPAVAAGRRAEGGTAPPSPPGAAHPGIGHPAPSSPVPSYPVVALRWACVVLAVAVEFSFLVWAVARLQATGLPTASAVALGSAFPVGMAAGRLAGPRLVERLPAVGVGSALTAGGTLLVVVGGGAAPVVAGLALAGLGVATLYPVTVAGLLATPGLSSARGASLGALASGTAVLAAPAGLALLASRVDLAVAFLVVLPLLAALAGTWAVLDARAPGAGPRGASVAPAASRAAALDPV